VHSPRRRLAQRERLRCANESNLQIRLGSIRQATHVEGRPEYVEGSFSQAVVQYFAVFRSRFQRDSLVIK
jgi:hypothetical protein